MFTPEKLRKLSDTWPTDLDEEIELNLRGALRQAADEIERLSNLKSHYASDRDAKLEELNKEIRFRWALEDKFKEAVSRLAELNDAATEHLWRQP